jgi:hypothetical protein
MNGQACQLAQFGGKGLGLFGLGTHLAGKVHGIPHHDARYREPSCQPCQRAQIFTPAAPPLKRQHRLSRQPEFVGYRHSNAAVSYVEAEVAGMQG